MKIFKATPLIIFIFYGLLCWAKIEDEKEKKPPKDLPAKVYNKIAPVLVRLVCNRGNQYGSGSIIGITKESNAVILTCCHVVAANFDTVKQDFEVPLQFYDDIKARVETDSILIPVSVIPECIDVELDLALVKTSKSIADLKTIRYNHTDKVRSGKLVAAFGYPLDDFAQTVGNIKRKEGGYLTFDAEITDGNSGGPLIDKFGRMIGVSRYFEEFKGEKEGYAVEIDTILTVTENWLPSLNLMETWKYKKYGNLWDRMFKDLKFIAGEVTVLGAIGYYIWRSSIPPDLPDPPALPK